MISSFFALVMMMLDPSPLAMQVGRMLSNLPLRSKTWGVTWREVGLQTESKQYQWQFLQRDSRIIDSLLQERGTNELDDQSPSPLTTIGSNSQLGP